MRDPEDKEIMDLDLEDDSYDDTGPEEPAVQKPLPKKQPARTKELAFTLACMAVCLAGIAAVGACVVSSIKTMCGANNTNPVYVAGNHQITELQAYYVGNDLHMDVYLKPDLDRVYVNDYDVTEQVKPETQEKPEKQITEKPVDSGDTGSSEDAVQPADEKETGNAGNNEVTDEAANDATQGIESSEAQNSETEEDDTGGTESTEQAETEKSKNDGAEEPADEAKNNKTYFPVTKEIEDELLEQMALRISTGGNGYLGSDIVYDIVPGDTLSHISYATGFSVDFLAAYNHIQDKNLIIAFTTLRYPNLSDSSITSSL